MASILMDSRVTLVEIKKEVKAKHFRPSLLAIIKQNCTDLSRNFGELSIEFR